MWNKMHTNMTHSIVIVSIYPTTITTTTKNAENLKLSAICFLITPDWFTQFHSIVAHPFVQPQLHGAGVCVCVRLNLCRWRKCVHFEHEISTHGNFYQPIIDTHLLHPGCLFFCRFNRTLIIILDPTVKNRQHTMHFPKLCLFCFLFLFFHSFSIRFRCHITIQCIWVFFGDIHTQF